MNIHDFQTMKNEQKNITMVTCYDYCFSQLIEQTNIDCVLVGDSTAMVMHGHANTISATTEMMVSHTRAVASGLSSKFIVGDMPFLSYRKSRQNTYQTVEKLMQAGAHAIKLEGADGNIETVEHIVESGVPVMGHLGLTPQLLNCLGGHKVQGKTTIVAEKLLQQAQALQQAGCFSLVLECVPWQVGQQITEALEIPTIGIGAGPYTAGQVLVLHDLLGLQDSFRPKFLKTYMEGAELVKEALNTYINEVKTRDFPSIEQHSYTN